MKKKEDFEYAACISLPAGINSTRVGSGSQEILFEFEIVSDG